MTTLFRLLWLIGAAGIAALIIDEITAEPYDPWSILLAPRAETDLLCPTWMSDHDCVVVRWEAFRDRMVPNMPTRDMAMSLCEMGACVPGNFESGPWLRACAMLRRYDWDKYLRIVDPCRCPRGLLVDDHLFTRYFWRNDAPDWPLETPSSYYDYSEDVLLKQRLRGCRDSYPDEPGIQDVPAMAEGSRME